MPSDTPLTWIAIAALVVGALVRAMKEDALGAILTRFFRPDGPPIAIPTRALPFLALALGAGSGVLDALIHDATLDVAARNGVMAAAFAVFGHELGSGVPGLNKLLSVGLLLFFTGCAAFQSALPFLPPPRDLACIIDQAEHGVRDPLVVIEKCPGLVNVAVADIERVLEGAHMAKAHRLHAEALDGGAK